MATSIAANKAIGSELELSIELVARGVKKAIKDAMRETVTLAEEWKRKHFPRDTGQLINMTVIKLSYRREPFTIFLACLVDYASYVEKMEDVHWTNPQTIEHFFKKWTEQVTKWFVAALKRNLAALTTGKVLLKVRTSA